MTLKEIEQGGRKPTLLELQESIREQKEKISRLESENGTLREEVKELRAALEAKTSIIIQQKHQIESLLEEREDRIGQKTPAPEAKRLYKRLASLLGHPIFLLVVSAFVTGLAILSSDSLREDCTAVVEVIAAVIPVADGFISTVCGGVGELRMVLVTMLAALLAVIVIVVWAWVVKSVCRYPSIAMRITICAAPIICFASDYLHQAIKSVNAVLLTIIVEILLILAQCIGMRRKRTR